MKKLNITKEQFNRSRYFKNKYGNLEYVSESGKLFKTNKGKILMFREHHDPEGFTKNPEIQKLSKKVLSKMREMRKMLDEWDVPSVSEKYKLGGYRIEITLKAGRDDSFSSIGGGRVLTLYVNTGHSGWGIFITADEQITYPYLFRGEDDVIEVFNVFLNQFSRDFDDYIAELDKNEMDNAYTESKKFGRKFNESADQTLEDIIDNIVTLSILSRDAESAEEMFQDLKQELFSMGLFSGQIHDDFDDFHDIAIDFAEHHNFNKQFVEQAAVTLKSEIEQELSRGEFGESTRRARRSARRFNENRVSQGTGNKELDKLNRFHIKVNSIHDQLENLISKYGLDSGNDPDMETYIDLLEEAEQNLLRVSADIYERIHMG